MPGLLEDFFLDLLALDLCRFCLLLLVLFFLGFDVTGAGMGLGKLGTLPGIAVLGGRMPAEVEMPS